MMMTAAEVTKEHLEVKARAVAPQALQLLEKFRDGEYVLSRTDIAGRLGVTDRVVRATMAELRKQGYLIVADAKGGYRFARSLEDVQRYTASLKSRVAALRAVIMQMEAAAQRVYGPDVEQVGLW